MKAGPRRLARLVRTRPWPVLVPDSRLKGGRRKPPTESSRRRYLAGRRWRKSTRSSPEKETRGRPSQRKIDSQLIYEWEDGSRPNRWPAEIWAVETDLPYADDGHLGGGPCAPRGGSGLASRLPAAGIDVLFAVQARRLGCFAPT